MATTFIGERFGGPMRRYEINTTKALESYALSLKEAKEVEAEGTVLSNQNGGSDHGSTEALYRLHASRFKCLIEAVRQKDDVREEAECEALRITEKHWYTQGKGEPMGTTRERIWNVLKDVVSALVQCPKEHSYFHRSVYRHAQALLWSAILLDPSKGMNPGTITSLPQSGIVGLEGLDSTKTIAVSAAKVISSLFDKKRGQLCAVWVSAAAATPFQTVNNTSRKYDAVRGKYISGYLETLKIANQRNDVENFIRWTSSCNRDYPSVFGMSRKKSEKEPSHTTDCLLAGSNVIAALYFLNSTKRLANVTLARIILNEMGDFSASTQKTKELFLKSAYGCFLRLNCEPEDFIESKWWRYRRSAFSVKPIADLLVHTYKLVCHSDERQSSPAIWGANIVRPETLQDALAKCKELFPSITGTAALRKISKKPKRKDQLPVDTNTASKDNDKRMFEVPVPSGVGAGGKFETTVVIEGITKTVRLTVPPSVPKTMRFVLSVSQSLDARGSERTKQSVAEENEKEKNSKTDLNDPGSQMSTAVTSNKEASGHGQVTQSPPSESKMRLEPVDSDDRNLKQEEQTKDEGQKNLEDPDKGGSESESTAPSENLTANSLPVNAPVGHMETTMGSEGSAFCRLP